MDFYYVDADYINCLKEYEKKRRGYTRVPNIIYQERNKFIFGAVMEINGINYYVALSSQKKKNESTIRSLDIPSSDEKM